MAETKHTKGEWKYKLCKIVPEAPIFGYKVFVEEKVHSIASAGVYQDTVFAAPIEYAERYPEMFYQEEIEANAKLISAAPELLEAIKYYFDVLEEVRGKDWDKTPDHVLAKMLSAFKKATT